MFGILIVTAMLGAPGLGASQAPQSEYVNNGTVTNEVVNATRFINNGQFVVSTGSRVPWDSQNTRVFENRGVMQGSVGFRLEYVDPGVIQQRKPADSFINYRTGQISGFDGFGNGFIIVGGTLLNGFAFAADTSFITVNAQSVTNRGLISSGAGGVVRVLGNRVDISGSALGIDPLGSFTDSATIGFGPFVGSTNFFPDPGLYDQGWGIEQNTNMFLGGILQPPSVQSPIFNITNLLTFCSRTLFLPNPQTWVRESISSGTNLNVEVVAVQTGDPSVTVDVRFSQLYFPGGISPQNGLITPAIELKAPATNLFTSQLLTNRIYIFDQLASSTNQNLLLNLGYRTFRPAPFVVFRGSDFVLTNYFLTGFPSNSVVTPGLFDSPVYSNQVVTNIQAAYAVQVESLQTRQPQISGVGPTNLPGRVEIRATDLSMTAARIRGEGLVSIQATNFLDASDSIVDVPRLALELGATGGNLRVEGLARDSVQRVNGPILMYSAVWTNQLPNPDTNAGPIEVRFHLTMVDASDLRGIEQTTTHELALSSRNGAIITVNDPFNVSSTFRVDSDNLTLNSRLVLQPGLSWSPTNLLHLSSFTNNGVLQSSELALFQQANGAPYGTLINAGRIQAYATLIDADYFENRGGQIISTQVIAMNVTNDFCLGTVAFRTNSAPSIGAISINAAIAKFEGGSARTDGDIRYTGGVFKFNNHRTQAGGRLLIDGISTLTDTGPLANNTWVVGDGFHLGLPRPEGDLLGTTINSFAVRSSFIDHVWSGEDRGPTEAGFVNNVAIGRLILGGDSPSRMNFNGASAGGNALYVDVLELEGGLAQSIDTLKQTLRLNGLNLYYAGVESVVNTNLTAEALNGLILGTTGGVTNRLIWVPAFAGPNTSVDILLSPDGSATDKMNLALRTSPNIDSDGDGIPNRYDEFPLFPDTDVRFNLAQFNPGAGSLSLGFYARPNSRYVIETTTNLTNPDWKLFQGNLQTGANGAILNVTDQVQMGSQQRYYRVRLVP